MRNSAHVLFTIFRANHTAALHRSLLRFQPKLDKAADGLGARRHIVFFSPFVDSRDNSFWDATRYSRITPGCRAAASSFLDFRY
jgi:hypothetical protein